MINLFSCFFVVIFFVFDCFVVNVVLKDVVKIGLLILIIGGSELFFMI